MANQATGATQKDVGRSVIVNGYSQRGVVRRVMERDAINKSRSAATMRIDINKTYRTKCGYPVVIYAIYEGQEYAVHGAYQTEDGQWLSNVWGLSGNYDGRLYLNLVEVRPEREVWINEYEEHTGPSYPSKEAADKAATPYRIALHRVVLNEDTVWQADAEREGDDE